MKKTILLTAICCFILASCRNENVSIDETANKQPVRRERRDMSSRNNFIILRQTTDDSRNSNLRNSYYEMSDDEVITAISAELSCVDPDIIDKLQDATYIDIPSENIFPYLEDIALACEYEEEYDYLVSNVFTLIEDEYRIYNFNNNGGYVVCCRDNRVPKVTLQYAYEGNLTEEELRFMAPGNQPVFMDSTNVNLPLRRLFFESIERWQRSLFEDSYFDIEFKGFGAYQEFVESMFVLTYCDNNISVEDIPICNYSCDAYGNVFRDNCLRWHQSYPYNFDDNNGYLIGSVPLTIAKILTYLGYNGWLYNEFFDGDSYMNGGNDGNLYSHLYNLSTNLCSYRSPYLSYATTTDGLSLLNELGIVFVHTYFNDWDSDIFSIYNYIANSQGLIVKIDGDEWQLIDAVYKLDANDSRCEKYTYLMTDKSKYTFVLSSTLIYDTINGLNTNAYPDLYDQSELLFIPYQF